MNSKKSLEYASEITYKLSANVNWELHFEKLPVFPPFNGGFELNVMLNG